MSDRKIKKVVMTGGSGPVGLALIKCLLSKNIKILLFQRYNSAKKMYLPLDDNLEIVWLDLSDITKYNPTETDYDVFFHLGWACTKSETRGDISSQMKNIGYTCNAVDLAYRMGCHTFVGVGSQAECGRHNEDITPNISCYPENAYGIAKLSANYFSSIKCEQYGIRHIWPRILSAYGFYDNINSILVNTILRAIQSEKLLFSKGDQIWDFVFLEDVAEAIYLIAVRGNEGVCYPIASGNARPLKEFLLILGEQMDCLDKMEFGAIPYSDKQIMYLSGNISKLTEDTGWYPKTEFEDGIRKTIEFYTNWNNSIKKKFLEERLKLEGY